MHDPRWFVYELNVHLRVGSHFAELLGMGKIEIGCGVWAAIDWSIGWSIHWIERRFWLGL